MLTVSRRSYLQVERRSAATSKEHTVGNYKCLLGSMLAAVKSSNKATLR